MKIVPEDLASHLKQSLKSLYILANDEPLQRQESLDRLRNAFQKQGFLERESFEINSSFDWDTFFNKLSMPSLFSEKQLIECHFQTSPLTKTVSEKVLTLKDQYLSDKNLGFILTFEKLSIKEQQSPWFGALLAIGCFINLRPLTLTETKPWLTRRLKEKAISLQPDAFDLLLERTEGNLMATASALEKLKMSGTTENVSVDTLLQVVSIEARFSVYDLSDALLGGNLKRTSFILQGLRVEGIDPTLVVWAIAREVRTILKVKHQLKIGKPESAVFSEQGIWKRRESLVRTFIKHKTTQQLQPVLSALNRIDDVIKGRFPGNPWDLLSIVCLNLTNVSGSAVCLPMP